MSKDLQDLKTSFITKVILSQAKKFVFLNWPTLNSIDLHPFSFPLSHFSRRVRSYFFFILEIPDIKFSCTHISMRRCTRHPLWRSILEVILREVRDLAPEDLRVCSGWKWFYDGKAWAAPNHCYSSSRCTRGSRKLFSAAEDLPPGRYQWYAASPSRPPAFARRDLGAVFCCI